MAEVLNPFQRMMTGLIFFLGALVFDYILVNGVLPIISNIAVTGEGQAVAYAGLFLIMIAVTIILPFQAITSS